MTEAASITSLIVTAVIIGFGSYASAQDININIGKMQYQVSCAACHGVDAKGVNDMTSQ